MNEEFAFGVLIKGCRLILRCFVFDFGVAYNEFSCDWRLVVFENGVVFVIGGGAATAGVAWVVLFNICKYLFPSSWSKLKKYEIKSLSKCLLSLEVWKKDFHEN